MAINLPDAASLMYSIYIHIVYDLYMFLSSDTLVIRTVQHIQRVFIEYLLYQHR